MPRPTNGRADSSLSPETKGSNNSWYFVYVKLPDLATLKIGKNNG